jgi:tRNA (mo5U34)-methyltransferase
VSGPPDDLRAAVAAQGWFHTIDLGHGIVTDGRDESPRKLDWIALPRDLRGRTVLDVGAWDGFFSFECERRGADRVVALDGPAWREPAWGPDGFGTRAGFELARRALGSSVEDVELELEDISPSTVGRFDVVLFLGVLYHLKHPWVALERVASVCDGLLILETHADLLDLRRPAMALYPGDEVAGDASNWWGPNLAALKAMLREEGFARVEVVHREPLPYRVARAGYRRLRGPRFRAQQGRVVVHAHRAERRAWSCTHRAYQGPRGRARAPRVPGPRGRARAPRVAARSAAPLEQRLWVGRWVAGPPRLWVWRWVAGPRRTHRTAARAPAAQPGRARPTRTRAPSSSSAGWRPERSQPGRVGPRVSSSTDASRAGPRQRLSKTISSPCGVTWRLRVTAANGSRRGRGRTVAWTDQPRPSASSSKPPCGCSGHSKRASVFGSAQFSRPPWTEGSESTAMNGTAASGPRGPSTSAGEASTSR